MAIKIDYSSYPDRERRSAFTASLIPESPYPSAGVTVPECRKIAKSLKSPDIEIRYIEDILIKGIVIFSKKESFIDKIPQIEAFLPHLVSWMVTDIAGPSLYCRKEDRDEAYSYFLSLIDRDEEMTKRLGIVTLMSGFLTHDRIAEELGKITSIHTDHYLLQMAAAWFTATAYTKFPEETIPYFMRLDENIKKKAKQKCRDSRRISSEYKERLKSI